MNEHRRRKTTLSLLRPTLDMFIRLVTESQRFTSGSYNSAMFMSSFSTWPPQTNISSPSKQAATEEGGIDREREKDNRETDRERETKREREKEKKQGITLFWLYL